MPLPRKDDDERVNRVPPARSRVDITADGELRGPELPTETRGNTQGWCERTKQWWDAWRRSPQAKLMNELDWESMFDAAYIHDAIWRQSFKPLSGTVLTNLLAELRRREGQYGATFEDRQRLNLHIMTPSGEEDEEAAIEAAAAEAFGYVERLTKKAAEAAEKAKKEGG